MGSKYFMNDNIATVFAIICLEKNSTTVTVRRCSLTNSSQHIRYIDSYVTEISLRFFLHLNCFKLDRI